MMKTILLHSLGNLTVKSVYSRLWKFMRINVLLKFEDQELCCRGKRYGDICICIADSLCYKAETNTPL